VEQQVSPEIAHFPVVELTQRELDELLEYSCSLPTGKTIGKRWKRNILAYNPNPAAHAEGAIIGPEWVMGEYIEDKDPEMIGIRWSRIKVKT
jgi:hypothetical protein